jgi:hypothetical protein
VFSKSATDFNWPRHWDARTSAPCGAEYPPLGPVTEIAPQIKHIPILFRSIAVLIPHPAYVAILQQSCVGEDQSVRLIDAQTIDIAIEIVHMTFTAVAIQPELY